MMKEAMEKSDISFRQGYEKLIEDEYLDTKVNMETSFYEQSTTENLWGLFINAGYLTIAEEQKKEKYRIRIPNNEVVKEFMSLTAYYLKISDTMLNDLFMALEDQNQKAFLSNYRNIILQMSSYHDFKDENSYHMLLLGMCAWLQNDYTIMSNRESGKGRSDLLLKSKKAFLSSFIIELKYMKKEKFERNPNKLKELAKESIDQIKKQQYSCELTGEIIHIGLAHAGKEIEMQWQKLEK